MTKGGGHDWFVAVVTFLATLAVNGLLFAYGYGKLEQRVQVLEQQREELREDWQAARTRLETLLKEQKR